MVGRSERSESSIAAESEIAFSTCERLRGRLPGARCCERAAHSQQVTLRCGQPVKWLTKSRLASAQGPAESKTDVQRRSQKCSSRRRTRAAASANCCATSGRGRRREAAQPHFWRSQRPRLPQRHARPARRARRCFGRRARRGGSVCRWSSLFWPPSRQRQRPQPRTQTRAPARSQTSSRSRSLRSRRRCSGCAGSCGRRRSTSAAAAPRARRCVTSCGGRGRSTRSRRRRRRRRRHRRRRRCWHHQRRGGGGIQWAPLVETLLHGCSLGCSSSTLARASDGARRPRVAAAGLAAAPRLAAANRRRGVVA